MSRFSNLHPVFSEHGVVFAVVYGSVYRGEEREDSDVDIAVYMSGDPEDPNYMDRYISLIDSLNNKSDREVDISDLRTCKDSFARRVSRNSDVIYDPRNMADDILERKTTDYISRTNLEKETEALKDRLNKEI